MERRELRRSVGEAFHLGADILKTTVKTTKVILAQIGDVLTEVNEGDEAEWFQHVGFISRPPKPEPKKRAAQCIAIRGGVGRDVVIASRDLRGLELAGTLDDGETCLYAAGPEGTSQGRILIKKTGSINLYSRKGNGPTGKGLGVFIDAESGTISLLNDKGFGLIVTNEGIRLTSKGATLLLKEDGAWELVGKGEGQLDGTKVKVGQAPNAPTSAVMHGISGISAIPSKKLFVE